MVSAIIAAEAVHELTLKPDQSDRADHGRGSTGAMALHIERIDRMAGRHVESVVLPHSTTFRAGIQKMPRARYPNVDW